MPKRKKGNPTIFYDSKMQKIVIAFPKTIDNDESIIAIDFETALDLSNKLRQVVTKCLFNELKKRRAEASKATK